MSAEDAVGLARDRLGIDSRDDHGARVDMDGVPEPLVWSNCEGDDCGTRNGRSQFGAGVRQGHCRDLCCVVDVVVTVAGVVVGTLGGGVIALG